MLYKTMPLGMSMLQLLRSKCSSKHSDAWYKYQVYAPDDPRHDDFGFVHFESKKEMNKFIKGRTL